MIDGHKAHGVATVAILVLLAGGPAVAGPGAPAAADPGDSPDRAAFSLSLTPPRLVVPAGLLDEPQPVQVANRGREPLDIEVGKRDFLQRPDGSLSFEENAPYSASNWVTATPDRFRLDPGTTAQVQVRFSPPAGPDAGDHQVVLVFLAPAPAGTANIRINRGVGLPIFLTVAGPVDDSVRLDRLSAPGFSAGGPVRLTATVSSTGTVHRDFRGPGVLGVKVAGRTVDFPDFTVTRGAVREVTTQWLNPPLFCLCRATLTVTAADGTAQVRSVRIVVVPVTLVLAVVAGVVLLVVAAFVVRRVFRAQVRRAVRGNGDA